MAREQRRLAAIVAADVVGYSRLMGREEAGTVARLRSVRTERLAPILARRGGRIVKLTGDGALIEFGSAVEALSAAIEFQQAVTEGETEQPEAERLVFRVGVHLGDVIVDRDDLYGDGVNVAARLEAEARADGIVVSGAVYEATTGRLAAVFDDLGRLSLKNIERPMQAYAVRWQSNDWPCPSAVASPPVTAAPTPPEPPLPLPDKPSIAVLPFQNMSGDPEQEYFADGMVEDIITELSRFKSLFVIARNPSFAYKGQSPDIRRVGRELGIRYVLEGSVRKAGDQVRITAQLIDTESGAHLWAERFDGPLADVFKLQDLVSANVVGAVAPKLDQAEIERAKRKPPGSLRAYDSFLRGLSHSYVYTRSSQEEARRLFYQAIDLDPEFSGAYGMAARYYMIAKSQGWTVDRDREGGEVRRLAQKVSDIGRDDASALAWSGAILAYVCGEYESGEPMVDQALAINPNLGHCWQLRGMLSVWSGRHANAIEELRRALRFSPLDPETYRAQGVMAQAYALQALYDEALAWAAKALARQPDYMVGLRASAVAAALSGRLEDAQRWVLRIQAADPVQRVSNLPDYLPFRRPEDVAAYATGLRLAGLPE